MASRSYLTFIENWKFQPNKYKFELTKKIHVCGSKFCEKIKMNDNNKNTFKI